jgi:uncharacterized protein YdhG (YjbR/CyaY superfamily)
MRSSGAGIMPAEHDVQMMSRIFLVGFEGTGPDSERGMSEVDRYIAGFSEEVQERLRAIRGIVREIAPQATERICMRVPTFDLNGKWLVHYAGYKRHIGFYPQPDGVAAFADRLGEFKTSKGAIQFPLSMPLPAGLIRDIVTYRVNQQSSPLPSGRSASSA